MNEIDSFLTQTAKTLEQKVTPKEVGAWLPEELHFELTYKCNSKCIMCNLRHLKTKEKELTADEINEITGSSKLLKDIKFVVLSGGEPLLRPDFAKIFKTIADNFPSANILILSNLIDSKLALEKLAEIIDIASFKRVSIGASLDGLGKNYDEIRKTKNGFDSLVKTIQAVRKTYPEIYISLNFTVTPKNYGQILPVYNWCKENNCHISFQVLVQKNETEKLIWHKKDISEIEKQISEIVSDVCRTNKIVQAKDLLFNKGLLSFLLSLHYIPKYISENKRFYPNCPCGQKFAMIDPFGNLYFCPVHKNIIAGNTRKESIDELWLSKEAGKIRGFFSLRKCHCWLTCSYSRMLEEALNA